MAQDDQLAKVASIVEHAPLSEILATIVAVAAFAPGAKNATKIVCEILRILIKVQIKQRK